MRSRFCGVFVSGPSIEARCSMNVCGPALPGCYSQADSLAELIDNVREAISGVLAVMREQGASAESNIQILDVAV